MQCDKIKIRKSADALLTDLKNAIIGAKIKTKFKTMWIQDCHDLIEICHLILSDQFKKAANKIDNLDSDSRDFLPTVIINMYYDEVRPLKEYR